MQLAARRLQITGSISTASTCPTPLGERERHVVAVAGSHDQHVPGESAAGACTAGSRSPARMCLQRQHRLMRQRVHHHADPPVVSAGLHRDAVVRRPGVVGAREPSANTTTTAPHHTSRQPASSRRRQADEEHRDARAPTRTGRAPRNDISRERDDAQPGCRRCPADRPPAARTARTAGRHPAAIARHRTRPTQEQHGQHDPRRAVPAVRTIVSSALRPRSLTTRSTNTAGDQAASDAGAHRKVRPLPRARRNPTPIPRKLASRMKFVKYAT